MLHTGPLEATGAQGSQIRTAVATAVPQTRARYTERRPYVGLAMYPMHPIDARDAVRCSVASRSVWPCWFVDPWSKQSTAAAACDHTPCTRDTNKVREHSTGRVTAREHTLLKVHEHMRSGSSRKRAAQQALPLITTPITCRASAVAFPFAWSQTHQTLARVHCADARTDRRRREPVRDRATNPAERET